MFNVIPPLPPRTFGARAHSYILHLDAHWMVFIAIPSYVRCTRILDWRSKDVSFLGTTLVVVERTQHRPLESEVRVFRTQASVG